MRSAPILLCGLVLLYGLIVAAIWWIDPMQPAWQVYLATVLTVAIVSFWLLKATPVVHAHSRWMANRKTWGTDIALITAPVLLALISADGSRWQEMSQHTALIIGRYLPWAMLQMVLLLYVPVRVLNYLGWKKLTIGLFVTVGFALVHLPNPLLMGFTGLAMAIWSAQYLAGRRLVAIALVMAIAASAMKLTVPVPLSADMKIGPQYYELRNNP